MLRLEKTFEIMDSNPTDPAEALLLQSVQGCRFFFLAITSLPSEFPFAPVISLAVDSFSKVDVYNLDKRFL